MYIFCFLVLYKWLYCCGCSEFIFLIYLTMSYMIFIWSKTLAFSISATTSCLEASIPQNNSQGPHCLWALSWNHYSSTLKKSPGKRWAEGSLVVLCQPAGALPSWTSTCIRREPCLEHLAGTVCAGTVSAWRLPGSARALLFSGERLCPGVCCCRKEQMGGRTTTNGFGTCVSICTGKEPVTGRSCNFHCIFGESDG